MPLSLHTLPVELVYRILDNLDDLTLFVACRNVCTRLNAITETYHRYQVIFALIIQSVSHHFSSASLFSKKFITLIHFLLINIKATDFVRQHSTLSYILSIKRIQGDIHRLYQEFPKLCEILRSFRKYRAKCAHF